jgi:hypothetical protein
VHRRTHHCKRCSIATKVSRDRCTKRERALSQKNAPSNCGTQTRSTKKRAITRAKNKHINTQKKQHHIRKHQQQQQHHARDETSHRPSGGGTVVTPRLDGSRHLSEDGALLARQAVDNPSLQILPRPVLLVFSCLLAADAGAVCTSC